MKLTLEVTSKEEAVEAIKVLEAYSGSTVAAKAVETKEEIKAEEPKKVPAKKTPTKKVEKQVEETEDDTSDEEQVETEKSDIDLKQLTAIAKEAVERTDRNAAKDVISKYGSKLSEVDESDYSALAVELEALGA